MSVTDFRWAPGHDVAYDDLITLDPQPHVPGAKATERTWSLSGAVFEQGSYAEWLFDVFDEDDQLLTLLTQIDLVDSLSGPVTINTLDATLQYARFNATVARPQIGTDGQWDQGFARGFLFLFTDLKRLA